jgi:hypothetical protein
MKIKAFVLVLLLSLGLVPSGVAADSYSKLLLSSAWCSVRPAPDGRWIRIVFHADGHYVLTGDHRGNEGHWRVKGRSLFMAERDTPLQQVAAAVRRNSRGSYILFVDGEEFARCK